MASLYFTLLPESLLRLHDVLLCLAKFSESVSIEAEYDTLRFTTLNSTKSAYASFTFDATGFFSEYSFVPGQASTSTRQQDDDKFSCQIYIRALLSVFKGRFQDFKDKDTAIERCEVELQDGPDETMCRFIVKMICRHGISFQPRISGEGSLYADPVAAQHALFDNTRTQNQWIADPKFLREIIEHFAPAAEQLDISSDSGKVIFTSFTAKVSHGNEILKQPVHTSVAMDTKDFNDFIVEDKLHVVITVKDFKAIVTHACSLQAKVTARYSRPCYPLQLAYGVEGIICEFTLMTRGERDERESTAMPPPAYTPGSHARPSASASSTVRNDTAKRGDMGPPNNPSIHSKHRTVQPLQGSDRQENNNPETPRPSASIDPDSLFVPADDDQQWDEQNYGDEDEDMLGWDASVDQEPFNESFSRRIQDNEPPNGAGGGEQTPENNQEAIPPTQRISQIRGLFD